jgi:parallel beta-helix repeat protein
MKNSQKLWTMTVVVLLLAGAARSGDLIVDQKCPQADDKNPGTLAAPFKTIQAAMDKAQPGDTVLVRAGSYHESLKFKHSGDFNGTAWNDLQNVRWISLEAYKPANSSEEKMAGKDDRAILDGSATIPAKDWKLVDGRANTYVAPFEGKGPWRGTVQMVFAADALLMPSLVEHNDKTQPGLPMAPAMPGDKTSDEGWYYDMAQNKLFVNLGGRVPGKDVEIAAAQLEMGVDMTRQSFVRIKGFDIRRFNQRAIWADYARDVVLEDNYVHHCFTGLWSGLTSGEIVRGNTFSDIMFVCMNVGDSRGTIIEGNLIRRFHVNPFKTNGGLSANYYSAAIMCNCSFGLVARNNIIADSDVDGIWPDCGSIGIALYGNAIYGLSADGFYIEDAAHGTVLKWNTVFNNGSGIVFRQNFANTAFENYVFNNRRSGLGIGSCDAPGIRADGMMYNWVIGNGVGAIFGPDKSGTAAHAVDHNTYCENGLLFQFGDKQFKDIKAVRDGVGAELHGQEVKDFDPAPLGLVTFRVHDTKESWKPMPMFGNPTVMRNDVQTPYSEVYFWKKGTFVRPEPYGWHNEGFGGMGGIARANADGFLRQLAAGSIAFVASKPDYKVDGGNDDPSACWKNELCLQVCAAPGKNLSAEGLGYWSSRLPTTDGAQIDLSLWARAKGIKPAGTNGGVYALAEFSDETGRIVARQYLAGADDGQKVVGADLVAGTYEYKKVSGMVTAPKGARWFRLAFGIRNCTGWAGFNNFGIQTRPGDKSKEVKVVLPIDAKQYKWAPCDLTALFNRSLTSEVAGDGKGWTDQGPTMDLRNLYAGNYTCNDVLFKVEKGNACFIMKNKHRPSEGLPNGGKTEFKGNADVIAFLHSGGWIDTNVRQATYVIHYADGQKVEIPVIGGRNIFDWTLSPTVLEGLKYEPELGFTQHAMTVPVHQFVSAYIWMTLWKNPRPDQRIAALEVKGANQGIPGLIAVSRGVAK